MICWRFATFLSRHKNIDFILGLPYLSTQVKHTHRTHTNMIEHFGIFFFLLFYRWKKFLSNMFILEEPLSLADGRRKKILCQYDFSFHLQFEKKTRDSQVISAVFSFSIKHSSFDRSMWFFVTWIAKFLVVNLVLVWM